MKISILQIERAINFWRDLDAARQAVGAESMIGSVMTLGRESRRLADVYGLMIHNRVAEVEMDSLSDEQKAALATAISP